MQGNTIIINESNDSIERANLMHRLTANEAKTQFGELLLKAQREPVQISRNGKPVAVVISIEDYEHMEALKRQLLQEKLHRAQQDIAAGNIVDGDAFFAHLRDLSK